jgi:hypothetical protein
MGRFGGGGSREETPPCHDFSNGSTTFEDLSSSAPSSMGSGNKLQDFSMAIQQQMIVQKVISKLTDRAFHKCITSSKSLDSLSGVQVACIYSMVNEWMDTNKFMMGGLAKKQQQQQQSGGY